MPPSNNGEMTDQHLMRLVGLVAIAATALGAVAAAAALRSPPDLGSLTSLAAVVSLTAVARLSQVRLRIRSGHHAMSWTDAAILIALTTVSTPLAVLCVGLGVGIANVVSGLSRIKIIFGTAKDTLAAGGGALVLLMLEPDAPDRVGTNVWALAAIYLGIVVIDEVVAIPVIALASRTPISVKFRSNLDIRLVSLIARFATAVVTLLLLSVESRLLVAVAPLVLSVHLWHSGRVRGRAEREAWQRLAAATEALNDVDLEAVLHLGVTRAAGLFSADEVEVEYRLADPPRVARGDADAVEFHAATSAPPPDGPGLIEVPLVGHESGVQVGVLRLWFRSAARLNERERYTLRTFASALCTAVRNAAAYAELERVAQEHAHAAAHDALTGLPNRRALLDQGGELLARRNADGLLALLLIDLNHFKEVNDTLGHAAGDQVLVTVAARLRRAATDGDVVARLGGDEFAVLLSGLPAPAVATHRAEALLAALNEPIVVDDMRISVEASGGIALANGTGGVAELLRRADVAMYQAKRAGQRTATYSQAGDTADVARLALGGELSRAVAEHEFAVDFQPIVDLASGEVIAAEALARWQHPQRGQLDPHSFVDTVERSNLLAAFADAVLDQALIAATSWRDAGFDLPVSVNVSPRSLLDARFPDTVLARLAAHDVAPERLVLELTETLTISQLDVVDRVLGRLRDAGVRLALDDFGTGYSTFSVLSRVPAHELKIDREFVRTMDGSAEAAAVVRSTLDLGRGLNLLVIAEGVESEAQRRALWELGCTAGQGHLFARPMASGRLLRALQRGSGGRPGTLAPPLHTDAAVIRIPTARRPGSRGRGDSLPHLPA